MTTTPQNSHAAVAYGQYFFCLLSTLQYCCESFVPEQGVPFFTTTCDWLLGKFFENITPMEVIPFLLEMNKSQQKAKDGTTIWVQAQEMR